MTKDVSSSISINKKYKIALHYIFKIFNYFKNSFIKAIISFHRLFFYFEISKCYSNAQFKQHKKLPSKIFYNQLTPLCKLMRKFGSDKGAFVGISKHNYTTIYFNLFKLKRYKNVRFFEMGIGTTDLSISANMGYNGTPGASLRAWKEFFKNGKIFSADIDKNVLFEEERIKTFYCDQTNEHAIDNLWSNQELEEEFDFIIDDGLHNFDANKLFLEKSIHKLKFGGIYIIEDIMYHEINLWKKYVENTSINCDFTIVELPNEFNKRDNNLLLVEKI